MRPLPLFAALMLTLSPSPAQEASDWGNLDALLLSTMTTSGLADASHWLPDAATPAEATEAVAVVYEPIQGAAGNSSIAVGVFRREGGEFVLAGLVDGIYGMMPADPAFHPDRIEFSTSTLNPDDARCCPTGVSRWAIDRATLTAREVD